MDTSMKLPFLTYVVLTFLPQFAAAQFAAPSGEIASFPLSELPTSARCLGLAGACTAIADDVDMLVANPAGATQIENTTVNVQLRYSVLQTVYLDQDAVDSEVLGDIPGQFYKFFNDRPTKAAFAGVSKPRWTLSAFYRHRFAHDSGVKAEEVWDLDGDFLVINQNALHVDMQDFGLSAAFQLADNWSVGLTVLQADMELRTEDSWQISSLSGNPLPTVDWDSLLSANRVGGDDSDTLFHFGLGYHPNGNWSAGLAYREGGEFNIASQAVHMLARNGAVEDLSMPASIMLKLPDSFSIGVGWRFAKTMLLSLDIEQLGYADLPPVRDITLGLQTSVAHMTESIDDTMSFRLGFEKRFENLGSQGNQYALRLGMFSEEDHDGLSIVEGYDTHFTVGLGARFGSRHQYRLDIGGEGGDEEINFIASFAYAFR
jgi:long-subunit fatty acid transport protein